jgi:hypothetical protein
MRGCRLLIVCFPAVLLLVGWRAETARGEEEVFKLGGMRNVTATVSLSDETYRITVEMLAVMAFDPATNKALNLSKGRMYAAQALGKHLKAGDLTIRGMNVRESDATDNMFRLVAIVPRDGVSTVKRDSTDSQGHRTAGVPALTALPQPEKALRGREIRVTADATTADFLNRKADYLDTIARLREVFRDEGIALGNRSAGPEDFYDSVVGLEERAQAAFKALGKQIDGDKLLVTIEQEELRLALKTAHAVTLESLKAAVARFEQRQEKMNKEGEKKK